MQTLLYLCFPTELTHTETVHLCQVGDLTHNTHSSGRQSGILCELFRLLWHEIKSGMTDLIILQTTVGHRGALVALQTIGCA